MQQTGSAHIAVGIRGMRHQIGFTQGQETSQDVQCRQAHRRFGVIDQSIIKHFKSLHGVVIGENTAETIKCQIGYALPPTEPVSMTVRGRDLRSGMPRAIEVTAHEVYEAIKPQINSIVNSVKMVLERTAPELASDLIEHGITMAGGTSQLIGLAALISRETGLPVHVAPEPLTCVARGCAALLEDLDALKQILEAGPGER